MQKVKFTISVPPRTKKNHTQFVFNRKTKQWKIIPSKQYLEYERKSKKYITDIVKLQCMALDLPVNVKAVFYMDSRRKCDLVNLEQALCDLLVKHGALPDDNFKVIASMDGSKVRYDKEHPRTEITITSIGEINEQR